MNPALQPLLQPRDALRPPSADGNRLGLALSLLAHLGLVVALALGVQWRTEAPEGVEAELWASTPQIAAAPAVAEARAEDTPPPEPSPPAPPPAPAVQAPPPRPSVQEREAELATERARELREKERKEAEDQRARERRETADAKRQEQLDKRRQEQAKAEQQAQDKAREQKAQSQAQTKLEQQRKELADATAREKARQDQLRRMNEQLGGSGAPGSTGTAARDAGPSANYAGRIKARIKPNIVLTDPVAGNPVAEVELRVAPDGSILSRRLVKASGVSEWDEAVLRAVDRTAVLPRDTDGRVPSTMLISFRPQD